MKKVPFFSNRSVTFLRICSPHFTHLCYVSFTVGAVFALVSFISTSSPAVTQFRKYSSLDTFDITYIGVETPLASKRGTRCVLKELESNSNDDRLPAGFGSLLRDYYLFHGMFKLFADNPALY